MPKESATPKDPGSPAAMGPDEWEALAAFRRELRRFLRFSEDAARSHGVTPQQHQLLLAIKGTPGRDWATIAELAENLQLRHHSVVGIVDRSEAHCLVERSRHQDDHRSVEVRLTSTGESVLLALTTFHRQELERMAATWEVLGRLSRPHRGLENPTDDEP